MSDNLRVGVLLRSFARTPDKVDSTVSRVMAALKEIPWYRGDGWFVSDVLVLIPRDMMYKDRDCGELARKLRIQWNIFSGDEMIERHANVQIAEVALGDIFVGAQNLAVNMLSMEGCDVMVTAAPSAIEAGNFDLATADTMMRAFIEHDARVSSIMVPEDGIDELTARGTLGGPITAWRLKSLIAVGGFNPAAAQAYIDEEKPNAGVEEIHPLVHLIKTFGPCIAPIMPHGVPRKRELKGEDLERHQKQIQTKTVRQLAHAVSLGVESDKFFDFFASGVMPQYRLEPVE